jgi:hypothetical protein
MSVLSRHNLFIPLQALARDAVAEHRQDDFSGPSSNLEDILNPKPGHGIAS